MPELLQDPKRLRKTIDELRRASKGSRDSAQVAAAIAEASLRIALHPDTPDNEAASHIATAVRSDPSNPKHAYHMARLCLVLGALDAAARWLEFADRLCPSSHRIWCHASVLHTRLNAGYHGNTAYEPDGLRRRAQELAEAIAAGQDGIDPALLDFTPPLARRTGGEQDGEEGSTAASPTGEAAVEPSSRRGPQRLIGAGRCRWSGVQDVLLEQALASTPNKRTMEKLLPRLQSIRDDAKRRPGGTAAFAIAATQWVVSGYPSATVRRLRAGLDGDAPSLGLLDTVCDLYECDEGDVAAGVAQAVSNGVMPAVLGATIHRRRVLWRPLEFRGLGSYRAARRAAFELRRPTGKGAKDSGELEEEAGGLARGVLRALEDLQGSRPVVLPDLSGREVASDSTPAQALGCFAELERAAKTLVAARDGLIAYFNDELVPLSVDMTDETVWGRVAAERPVAAAVIEALVAAGAAGRSALENTTQGLAKTDAHALSEAASLALPDLLSAATPTGAPPEPITCFAARADDCAKLFKGLAGLGNLKKRLIGVAARLDDRCGDGDPPQGQPSADLLALQTAVRDALPPWVRGGGGEVVETPAEEDGHVPRLPDEPLAKLDAAAAFARSALEERFGDALSSLDAYPPEVRASEAFRGLTAWIRSRQAETLFRLGDRREARRIWNRMLADDRLDCDAARNIAVCDATSRDIARSLASWSDYFELLVVADVAAQTPRAHAPQRADLARALADSFADGFLLVDMEKFAERLVVDDAVAFLSNPSRLRAFVTFRLLEQLERRLALTSPTLVLGVSHSGSDRARREGADALRALVEQLTPALPPRVADIYGKLVLDHIDKVLESSSSPSGRARRDPAYKEQYERLLKELKNLMETKVRVVKLLSDVDGAAQRCTSGLAVPSLAALDAVRFVHDNDVAQAAATGHGWRMDVELAQDAMSQLVCPRLMNGLFERLDSASERESEALAQELSSALGWAVERPEMATLVDALDDYRRACPKELSERLNKAIESGHEVEKTASLLRRRLELAPQITWPAVLLSLLLSRADRFDEAIAVLDKAFAEGVVLSGRTTCAFYRMQAWRACVALRSHEQDVPGTKAASERALSDAQWVLEHSERADEREQAETTRVELEEYLAQCRRRS